MNQKHISAGAEEEFRAGNLNSIPPHPTDVNLGEGVSKPTSPESCVGRRYAELKLGKEKSMIFNTGAALLDAIVLAVVSKEPEGTYGYKITQDVRQVIDLSESTLYPVLRRLQKDDCLEVYDRECAGRNRRYYKVTSSGWAQLRLYEGEWRSYSDKITSLFEGKG